MNFKLRIEKCELEQIGKVSSEKTLPDTVQCAEKSLLVDDLLGRCGQNIL